MLGCNITLGMQVMATIPGCDLLREIPKQVQSTRHPPYLKGDNSKCTQFIIYLYIYIYYIFILY